MSTSTNTQSRLSTSSRQMLKQRGIEATQRLRDALNLTADLVDTAILGTALAESATREIARNPQFGREVAQLYQDMMNLQRSVPTRPSRRTAAPLVPLRHAGGEVDPFSPPDPQKLIYVYGIDQLDRALQDFTMDMLKQTVEKVQREHPGTRPASKARKAALIEYIVHYSTNGR